MKNKNLFKESRFVWFARGDAKPEVVKKSPEEEETAMALDFIKNSLFGKENFSDEAYKKANEAEEFKELLEAVKVLRKGGDNPKKELLEAASLLLHKFDREIKTAKVKAELDSKGKTKKKLDALRGKLKAAERNAPAPLPEKPEMSTEEFLAVDSIKERNDLDRLKMNVNREDLHLNAQKWDPTNRAGLTKIYNECRDLEIPVHTKFYQSVFAILNRALDQSTNPNLPKHKAWYMKPANHLSDIAGLPGGDQYVKAYEHLIFIQGEVLIAQDKQQVETLAKQGDLDSDPLSQKASDFVRSNISKIQKAVRERDYATVGLYAVGLWAMYKAYKKLSAGKEDTYGKWLVYGAALYAGNIFLKNAGYDVLKMAGFRDPDYEVKGTPMEIMRRVLQGNEVAWRTTSDLDYGLVLRSADIKLTTLDELYHESNKHGVQFIEPKEFPAFFPEIAGKSPFNKGLGERGLKDPGMGNIKLSPAQREYVQVGKQLYKLAFAMRAIYDDTLKTDHPSYKNRAYEEALKDPTVSMAKVRHLIEAVSPYATSAPSESILSKKKLYEVEGELKEAFVDEKNSGFRLESQLAAGHYKGWLQGFPVVFVWDKGAYRVYLINDYEGEKKPGSKYVTSIPEKGPSRKLKAKEAVDAVKKRVSELLLVVGSDDPASAVSRSLNFNGANWICDVSFDAVPEFGIAARTDKSTIEVDLDGKGVSIKTKTGARLNLNEEMAKQNPVAFILSEKITTQEEFRALQVFSNAGRLDVIDVDRKTRTLTMRLGKGKIPAKLKYNGTKFEFADPAQEAALIQDKSFAREYVDAVRSDEHYEFNKIGEDLKSLIKNSCPEGFLKFFFKSLAGQTMRGELGGFNADALSGSIPDNFTDMLIDSSRQASYDKLNNALKGVNTLAAVETARNDSVQATYRDLKIAYDKISTINRKKISASDDWTRMEFMLKVVDDINGAGAESTNYQMQKTDMRYLAYKMDLPGLLSSSDFNEKSHHAVGKLMNVFTYYTASLDTKDLDTLKYPPRLTPPFVDTKSDPNLDGHYKLNYFEYVKDRIANEAPQISGGKSLEPNLIPEPSDRRWKIMDYAEWKQKEGNYQALDVLDNGPALKHEQSEHDAGKHTKLDEELMNKLKHKKDMIISLCKDDLDIVELENYLHSKDPNAEIEDLGIFNIYEDDQGKIISRLWTDTDKIAAIAGDRRSIQERMMNDVADKFLDFVFTAKAPETGKPRFFKNNPGIWERIKLWYYKFKYNVD